MNQAPVQVTRQFDIDQIRSNFPILGEEVNGHRLAYLDNAATTQKPIQVVERVARYYRAENSNVHRGVHSLSQRATDAFESVRERVRQYIGAADTSEVVFTSGTTDAINLVAFTLGSRLGPDDRVLITGLEHHSNIVPWQLACERTGATLDVVPVLDSGELDMQEYARLLDRQPALVAAVHTSNSLGTINDIKTMSAMAHEAGSLLLVDAAQAMAHGPVDVQDLGCDFLCLSAHKMFGPTGVGVLYGRRAILESLPPWRGGGDMIDDVSFDGTTFAELPARLEAGTPNIAGVIGFGATIDFLEDVDWSQIEKHETHLLGDATRGLLHIGGISIVGPDDVKAPVISFNIDGVHPYDTGTILDQLGVAVRTGHHCTMPLMKRFGLPGTVRASFALYNNDEDVAQFVSGVEKAKKMLL